MIQILTASAVHVCIFVYLSDYVGKMNGAGIPGIIAVSYCGRPVFSLFLFIILSPLFPSFPSPALLCTKLTASLI